MTFFGKREPGEGFLPGLQLDPDGMEDDDDFVDGEEDDEEDGGVGLGRPPRPDMAFDRDAQRAADDRGPRRGQDRDRVIYWLNRAQAEVAEGAQAAADAELARFRGLKDREQRLEIRTLCKAVNDHRLKELDTAMGKINFDLGAGDLKKLMQALTREGRTPDTRIGIRGLRNAAGRETEVKRREHFQNAVLTFRGAAHVPAQPGFQDRLQSSYSTVMFAASTADVNEYYVRTARLQLAQQTLFTGRNVTMYMDTGLLTIDHRVFLNDAAVRRCMHSYAAFFHLCQPYIGVARDAVHAVYRINRTTVTTTPQKDSIREGVSRGWLQQREFDAEGGARARYRSGGDLTGRVARANHFAILEQMILDPEYSPVAAEWQAIKRQFEGAGVSIFGPMASMIEEFRGAIATEYTALLWRVVTNDSRRRTEVKVGIDLPEIPEHDVDQRFEGGQNAAGRTFQGLQIGGPTMLMRLDGLSGAVPQAAGAQPVAPLTDQERLQCGISYVRRLVYSACAHLWYPHKLIFIHTLNALEYSAIKGNFRNERSLMTDDIERRRQTVRASDDMAELVIADHRAVCKQIHDGTVSAITDALDRRSREHFRKEMNFPDRRRKQAPLPGEEGNLLTRAADYIMDWKQSQSQWLVQRKYDDLYAMFNIDYMYSWGPYLTWRGGHIIVLVATGYGVYKAVCFKLAPVLSAASKMVMETGDTTQRALEGAQEVAAQFKESPGRFIGRRLYQNLGTSLREAGNFLKAAVGYEAAKQAAPVVADALRPAARDAAQERRDEIDYDYDDDDAMEADTVQAPIPVLPAVGLSVEPTRVLMMRPPPMMGAPPTLAAYDGPDPNFPDSLNSYMERGTRAEDFDNVVVDGHAANSVPINEGLQFGRHVTPTSSHVAGADLAEAFGGGAAVEEVETPPDDADDFAESAPAPAAAPGAARVPAALAPQRAATSSAAPVSDEVRRAALVASSLVLDMDALQQALQENAPRALSNSRRRALGLRPAASRSDGLGLKRSAGTYKSASGAGVQDLEFSDYDSDYDSDYSNGENTGKNASVKSAARDFSRMSFATGAPASTGNSFWECGNAMAFGKWMPFDR